MIEGDFSHEQEKINYEKVHDINKISNNIKQ